MGEQVVVLGAGTMGRGIAQVAAVAGWAVHLRDVDEAIVGEAIGDVRRRLDRLVEKGRMDGTQRDEAAGRLHACTDEALGRCPLLIEAIVEDLEVKASVLGDLLPGLPADAIVATNTSSLSVTDIGRRIGAGPRTVGMHFFNPAPLMRLVEVIAGADTDPAVVARVADIAAAWGKQVARAADVPGFIVNHVARPYYLEAFRILEDGYADPAEIDAAMRALGGFRMGPLELTDLIGQDVNTATTRSVWEQLDRPPLLAPSRLQEQLVRDGHLGRKSGRGVYSYADAAAPVPAVDLQRRALAADPALTAAVDRFVERAVDPRGDELSRYVFARVLAALIVQAAMAHARGVAEREDIDTALKYGTNYPHGPFEWAERIGADRVAALLDALNATAPDGRFAMGSMAEGSGFSVQGSG